MIKQKNNLWGYVALSYRGYTNDIQVLMDTLYFDTLM